MAEKNKDIAAKPFAYNTDCISKKQFEEHLKLYTGYVNKTNEITALLSKDSGAKEANAIYSRYRGIKCSETFALDGVLLHEAYFQNMGMPSQKPGPLISKAFDEVFGGYEGWRKDFIACGTSARGWAVFCYEQRTCSFRNFLQDAHNEGVVTTAFPLIVMDMYEHAYFLDYGTDKAAYMKRFLECIRWDVVETRMSRVKDALREW